MALNRQRIKVKSDLGPNSLQRLSVDKTNKQKIKVMSKLTSVNNTMFFFEVVKSFDYL